VIAGTAPEAEVHSLTAADLAERSKAGASAHASPKIACRTGGLSGHGNLSCCPRNGAIGAPRELAYPVLTILSAPAIRWPSWSRAAVERQEDAIVLAACRERWDLAAAKTWNGPDPDAAG
jgi:hypothetical protein